MYFPNMIRHRHPYHPTSSRPGALEQVGFEVCDMTTDSKQPETNNQVTSDKDIGYLDRFIPSSSSDAKIPAKSKYPSRHILNCEACRLNLTEQHGDILGYKGLEPGVSKHVTKGKENMEKALQPVVVVDSIPSEYFRATLAIGGMTCASCAGSITEELNKKQWVEKVVVNLISGSAVVDFVEEDHKDDLIEIIESIGFEAALDSVTSLKKPQHGSQNLFRASLAVGGMTCASCANNIVKGLETVEWIRKTVVNLIANSASIDFVGEEHKDDLVESIEAMGYEATIDSIIRLDDENSTQDMVRTVDIKVDGMFCEHCPARISESLATLGDRVKIDRLLSVEKPVMRVSYTPDAPDFTVRNILETISDTEVAFSASINHEPTLEERSRKMQRREQFRILIRVILTFVIAIPTLIIGIVYMSLVKEHDPGRMFLMHPLRAGISRAQWALFIMATPVYFLCADVFHVRAIKEIRSLWRWGSRTPIHQRFLRFGSMNMLMSLGTSVAYISSTAQLISAGVHPAAKPDDSTFYFDSVVFLTLFLLVGRLIESYSKSKTGDAVTLLGKLRPTEAILIITGSSYPESINGTSTGEAFLKDDRPQTHKTVSVDLLDFGDVVKVLQGGSPPCDGVIVQGETKFDESSLTGESKLVKKTAGDQVFSGTVNKDSPVSIRITGVAGSSMLDQIVAAVRDGQTKRAPMEAIADALTSYFVPGVILISILTWIVWLSLGISGVLPRHWQGPDAGGWVAWSLQFAIATLIVACPCGLALAAPTALFVGGGLAAQHGILVKGGGEAFEKASKLDCIVFDKTGTLTHGGEPVVTDFKIFPVDCNSTEAVANSGKTILSMVNGLENNSSHTIAKALKEFCAEKNIEGGKLLEVAEIAGKGLAGSFNFGRTSSTVHMLVGNELLMLENRVSISESTRSTLESWKSQGRSVALAAIQKTTETEISSNQYQLAAIFAISDPIRPEAPAIITSLQKRGTEVWMLSGDNQITANAIGAQVGIPTSNIIAGVLPSQKAEKIQYLQKSLKAKTFAGGEHAQKRALVAMVGDGINDSPALTTADVGIAIGSGSDIAISSAEFVLVSSSLKSLITLLDLSKVVFRRIKFNFAWALVYNMIALPVAAGVLYPIVSQGKHVRLDPVWASLAMAASSISVVCSSLLLRSRVPWLGFRVRKMEQ
ncbi:putative copper-transporting ATPase 3 [Glarea lozoyensis 74030]|uniref:Putative copper-transporting ATPase 3 n=1 Tax=Glarea lozoyensis (strain ATCC 74030 / MF5533) TaxID=1104152 RepID=H0EW79_GLAL7|nr:putative copper-transporting ATPase 3 [Glarea lozoyensis 74030]